jgi:tRNA threonylcarbamoyladenosine biosynthesis protein TsaB
MVMRSDSKVLLAIDTSCRNVGIALYNGVQVLNEFTWRSRDHHTVELAPAIDDALRKANLTASNLGAIGVALGPGSFTGLRIGLALAKGIAIAQGIPIAGVPTLDSIAYAQPITPGLLAAVLQAGRSRLGVNWYQVERNRWHPTNRLEILTLDELLARIQEPTVVCGELTNDERRRLKRESEYVRLTSPAHSLRRPAFLAEIAWKRWQGGTTDDPATLSPIYLHHDEPIPG